MLALSVGCLYARTISVQVRTNSYVASETLSSLSSRAMAFRVSIG